MATIAIFGGTGYAGGAIRDEALPSWRAGRV